MNLNKLIGKRFYGISTEDDIIGLKIRDDNTFYVIDVFGCLCIKKYGKLVLTDNRIDSKTDGVNLFDKRIEELFIDHDFIIEDIAVNFIGDCSIVLNYHLNIDIFINSSAKNRTFWRLVQYDEFNEKVLYEINS